jgi:hypothetical protein
VSVEQGSRRAEAGRAGGGVLRAIAAQRPPRAAAAGRDVGLVIYDECHHAAAEDNLRVLRELGCFDPDWDGTLVGFTATTARGDGKGLDEVFEEIVYARTLPEMIPTGTSCRCGGTAWRPAPTSPAYQSGYADSARTSSPRPWTSRSATPWWRAPSRSSPATVAPSRSA